MPDTKLLAVTGNPVMHSRSPLIFNRLFQDMGIEARYLRLAASNAGEAMRATKDIGLQGLNVTSPFKEEIIPFLNDIDPHAEKIQSVNCLVCKNDSYKGYNTDRIGAVQALKNNGVDPRNKRIAVLGAGGAARSAVYGLIEARAARVTLLNRTVERAQAIANRLGCHSGQLKHIPEILEKCDILVSCLPTQHRILDPACLKKTIVVMDANYSSSPLIEDAKAKGCQTVNGLEWLVHQAHPAFKIFFEEEIPQHLTETISEDLLQRRTEKKPNIALIGFMGSGKTEVGRRLADKMRFGYIDTDSLIQNIAGTSIADIFKTRGESSFRAMEQAAIRRAVQDSRGYVFSLGGGAILNPESVRVLRKNCHMVWLWASRLTIRKRADISNRPLLHPDNSRKSIEQMLAQRIPHYAQTADLVICNEVCDADKTAERIKHEMDQAFGN